MIKIYRNKDLIKNILQKSLEKVNFMLKSAFFAKKCFFSHDFMIFLFAFFMQNGRIRPACGCMKHSYRQHVCITMQQRDVVNTLNI